jgi:hypothetical protein
MGKSSFLSKEMLSLKNFLTHEKAPLCEMALFASPLF